MIYKVPSSLASWAPSGTLFLLSPAQAAPDTVPQARSPAALFSRPRETRLPVAI